MSRRQAGMSVMPKPNPSEYPGPFRRRSNPARVIRQPSSGATQFMRRPVDVFEVERGGRGVRDVRSPVTASETHERVIVRVYVLPVMSSDKGSATLTV